MPRVPQFIIDQKQPPRSIKHGNRKAGKTAHSNSSDRTSSRDDRADAFSYAIAAGSLWRTNIPNLPIMPLPDPSGATADHLKQMQEILQEQMRRVVGWDIIIETSIGPPPIPHAGILAGEIIGYRLWWVNTDGRLRSLVQDAVVWSPDHPMTGDIEQCVFLDPNKDRYGGVYAFLYKADAHKEFLESVDDLNHHPDRAVFDSVGIVLGTVKLWGEVVEHELGYRASYAKPRSILESYYWAKPAVDPKELYSL